MIFHPGFSTADEATEDAGRGVGMSAVRDVLAKLGGRISLRQQMGQFCEFLIVLPNGG
jgi:chemotaxis protein histidine kinase CheA